MQKISQAKGGFTLVELAVVITLIVLILSIIFASISQARQNTREQKRVADLSNIQFALTLYKEKNREYPSVDGGVEIGMGGELDAFSQLVCFLEKKKQVKEEDEQSKKQSRKPPLKLLKEKAGDVLNVHHQDLLSLARAKRCTEPVRLVMYLMYITKTF